MNDPVAGMGTPGAASPSAPQPGAGWVLSARRGTPGAPDPGAASGSLGGAPEELSAGRAPGRRARERDCESWVREKVLFLLHPERWLGTQGAPTWEEVPGGETLPETGGDAHDAEPDRAGARFPQEKRLPGALAAAAAARPRGPAAPRRSVLVRVVDYQVTREVQCTAWRKGRVTTRTEERSVTAVTFRTDRE